jgi:hypothetical protein
MDILLFITSIAFGLLITWIVLYTREMYVSLHTDPGDDPSKYYASPMEVMDNTLYVTNPESLYAGFSLEPGNVVQKVPIGPVVDRLGNFKQIPGLPSRDILYPIREDADLESEMLPMPGSGSSEIEMFPVISR